MLAVDPAEVPSRPLLRHLLCDVATLPRSLLPPGKGHLSISVLFSPPRQHKNLYPWAHLDDPRAIASGSRPFPGTHDTVQTWEEMVFFHAEWRSDDDDADDARMICAIEGYNYTLPEHGSGVFYLSKIDTTGYSPRLNNPRVAKHLAKHDVPFVPSNKTSTRFHPSTPPHVASAQPTSLTTHLTISLLTYFLRLNHHPRLPVPSRPLRHMSIHILARAQGAYLFPNSPENPMKRPLSDTKLIIWWREVLSRVIDSVKAREWDAHTDARYMVPGLEAFESHPLVPLPPKVGDSALARAGWKYGHPYTVQGAGVSTVEELPPLPLHLDPSTSRVRSLANLIPRFEDDPQSRFLDELAEEGQEPGRFPGLFEHRATSQARAQKADRNTVTPQPPPTTQQQQSDAKGRQKSASPSQASLKRKSPGAANGDSAPPASGHSPRKSQRTSARSSAGSHDPATPTGKSTPTPRPQSPPTSLRRSPRKSTAAISAASAALEQQRPTSPTKSQRGVRSSSSASSQGTGAGGTATPHAPQPRLTTAQISAIRSRVALDNVSPDEFWIRMGFRQECSSGNLVGAFFLSATFDRHVTPDVVIKTDVDAVAVADAKAASSPPPSHGLIAPQPRPRFTIPLTSLYKSMRNNLQLDDCWWDKKRESIELTQEFDEQRGRLLLQFGSLAEHEKTPSESGYDEDIDITLHTLRGISSGGTGGRLMRKTRNRRKTKGEVTPIVNNSTLPLSSPSPEEVAEEQRMQQEYLVGKGVVWQTIPLTGYDAKMVQDATVLAEEEKKQQQQEKEQHSASNGTNGTTPSNAAPVTMLTVKRRKKK